MRTALPRNANYRPRPSDPTVGVAEREVGWISRVEPPARSLFNADDNSREFWFDVLSEFSNVRGLGPPDVAIANLLVTCESIVQQGGNADMNLTQAMTGVAKWNKALYDRAAEFERRFGDHADEQALKNKRQKKDANKKNGTPEPEIEEDVYDPERQDNLGGFFQ